MILGITGGLGCGKSTAGRLFERRGFRRLDSDVLVRETILTAPSIVAAIRARFGPSVLDASGAVNRAALADRIFVDDSERIWLEELTHPMLFHLWRTELGGEGGVDALAADGAPTLPRPSRDALWVFEVPLLFEQSLENWFDFTICVACSYPQQIVRLEQRGLNRVLAGQRISKQLPLGRKIELADFVLWNEGSAEFLQAQVDVLVDSLMSGAGTSALAQRADLTL